MTSVGRDRNGKAVTRDTRYFMNSDLAALYIVDRGRIVKWNVVIMLGFYLIFRDYPRNLATLDFMFLVLNLTFVYVVLPLMLRGKIRAYYRREYPMTPMRYLLKFLIQGGMVRGSLLAIYYALTMYLVRNQPIEFQGYESAVTQIIFNPMMDIIGIVVYVSTIYSLFYYKRFASIEEFSRGIADIYNSHNVSFDVAMSEFIRGWDEKLEMESMQGLSYDDVDGVEAGASQAVHGESGDSVTGDAFVRRKRRK